MSMIQEVMENNSDEMVEFFFDEDYDPIWDEEEQNPYLHADEECEEEKDPREEERDWFRKFGYEFPENDYSHDAELMRLYQESIDRAVDAYEEKICNPREY